MKSFFHYFTVLVVSITILSCKQSKQEPTATETTPKDVVFFTPNPQKVKKQEIKTLEVGAKAPDFKLPGVDGKYHTLSEYTSDVLVILFTCNHCPTAQAYEDRVITFVDDYKDKNVELIAISSNSILGLLPEELGYSDLGDSFEDMKVRVEEKGYNFPYLYDGDTQEVALKYGPVATPHIFVFDKTRNLQYVGRLDGTEKPGTANAEDLRNAVDALLSGASPEVQKTKTFGCSTKWGWKFENKVKADIEWKQKPVELTRINEAGIKTLLKNVDSKKLRLLNIWATWCGPCRIEYPEFVNIQRMFAWRDLEFISLSADNLKSEAKALEFLKNNYSAVENYIFENEDKYALIEAIDPDWDGALPYTLLIEPNGNIAWTHQGEVDFRELKKVIVEHDMIGRYY